MHAANVTNTILINILAKNSCKVRSPNTSVLLYQILMSPLSISLISQSMYFRFFTKLI